MLYEWGWGSYIEFFFFRIFKYCFFLGYVGGEWNIVLRIWVVIVEGRVGLLVD